MMSIIGMFDEVSNLFMNKIHVIKYEMSRRITIMLSEELYKKLRVKQAAEIKKSAKSVSFSKVISDTLKHCI